MVERDIDAAFAWPEDLPPCPKWCRHREIYGGDHHYDGPLRVDVATFVRSHVSDRSDPHLTQREDNRDGVVTLARIMITVGGGGETMTSSEAPRYAAEPIGRVSTRSDRPTVSCASQLTIKTR
jgi:hypothetical protein